MTLVFAVVSLQLLAALPGGASSRAEDKPRRLSVVNACRQPVWITHEAAAGTGPDPQDVRVAPGASHAFLTPNGLSATRYWAKLGCNEQGTHCALGGSGGPKEACVRKMPGGAYNYSACAPPIDTKFEASFGQMGEPCNPMAPGGTEMAGCDYIDMSLVDGFTLAFKLEIHGGRCTATSKGVDSRVQTIDCSTLSFDDCPAEENLGLGFDVDLRAVSPHTGTVAGCYAPCMKLTDTKWNNTLGAGRTGLDAGNASAPYCCPTPPVSPEECRQGPVTSTRFVRTLHEKCPGVYGYAYDDGHGLMRCSSDSHYKLTLYCPFEARDRSPGHHSPATTTAVTTTTIATTTTTRPPITVFTYTDHVTIALLLAGVIAGMCLAPAIACLGKRWSRDSDERSLALKYDMSVPDYKKLHDPLYQESGLSVARVGSATVEASDDTVDRLVAWTVARREQAGASTDEEQDILVPPAGLAAVRTGPHTLEPEAEEFAGKVASPGGGIPGAVPPEKKARKGGCFGRFRRKTAPR
jgi:hypothetical protein